jgi:hypothetical protein
MWRALALLALVVGCDSMGSGDGGGNQTTAADPKSDCAAFISQHYCPALVPCYPDLTQDTCVASAQTGIDCSAAVGESGDLGTCELQLDSSTCDELTAVAGTVTLPASCQNVFF